MRPPRSLVILMMFFGAPGCAQRGIVSWYGNEIGEPPQAGAHERIRNDPDATDLVVPPPWRAGMGSTDADGRMSELKFYDPCCEMSVDETPGNVPRRFKSADQILADGKAALAYAVARLGKPTTIERIGSGNDSGSRATWDFRPRFVRCNNATPIFAAPSHEPTGKIALVTLVAEPQEVRLSVSGRNARSIEETMSLAGESEGDGTTINSRQLRDAKEECQASDRADSQPAI